MTTKQEIQYGQQDPKQIIDLYLPDTLASSDVTSLPPLVVFVHGGAWRTGAPAEHVGLGEALATRGVAVALVGYRLSLAIEGTDATDAPCYSNPHPAHLEDIFSALRYLILQRTSLHRDEYDANNILLAGHSVGAWMVAAVLLDPHQTALDPEIPSLGSTEGQSQSIRSSIRMFVLLDGIYNLVSLLGEYPSYRGFVSQAVPNKGDESTLKAASATSWPLANKSHYPSRGLRSVIVHSNDDELLSFSQSIEMATYLSEAANKVWPRDAIDGTEDSNTRPVDANSRKKFQDDAVLHAEHPYVSVDFATLKVSDSRESVPRFGS